MKPKRQGALAEDLRKIGTTAVAAAVVGLFLSDHKSLTACALVTGAVIWLYGIYLTKEE